MISLQRLDPLRLLENDTVLAEMNQKFGGNYLGEDHLIARPRAPRAGNTAVDRQGGRPASRIPPPSPDGSQTLILDDNTGHEGGFGLPAGSPAR